MSTKWNQDLRREMYRFLKNKFGTVSKWKATVNPTGNIEDFRNAHRDLSVLLTYSKHNTRRHVFSPTAVEAQMAWGVQAVQSRCLNRGMVINYIYNRAAAMEVGLISSCEEKNKHIPANSQFSYV